MSARGCDVIDDAIDFGRPVIAIVREEVAKRDSARGPGNDAGLAADAKVDA